MRRTGILIVAVMAAGLAGCGKSSGDKAGAESAPAAPAAAPTAAEAQALLADLPAPYNTGDIANGEAKEALCKSCHTTAAGGAKMTGPNLHGVFGRKAGSVEDFKYSDALTASGIVWDAARIDAWIADPHAVVPQTKMSFVGMKDPKDRIDLVAYLKVATSR